MARPTKHIGLTDDGGIENAKNRLWRQMRYSRCRSVFRPSCNDVLGDVDANSAPSLSLNNHLLAVCIPKKSRLRKTTATGDVLATDSGSDSNQRSYGSGNTHNDSASGSDMHHGHASGPLTDAAGAVTAEDINYTDDDRSKGRSQSGNYQAFATGQGGSST